MENHKEELAQKGLSALQKEFLVIGKTHIKAWHAWLILGIVAGAVGGVFLVAQRGGFEGILASERSQIKVILPAGKERFMLGERINIAWESRIVSEVTVTLQSKKAQRQGGVHTAGVGVFPDNNSRTLTPKSATIIIPTFLTPANDWKIIISENNKPKGASDKSKDFSIVSSEAGGSLSVVLDSASPPLRNIAAGSMNVELLRLKFSATNEDIDLKQVVLQLSGTEFNTPNDLVGRKVDLYDGATKIAEAVFATGDNATSSVIASGAFRIPKDASKVLIVKGDIATISPSGPLTAPGDHLRVDWDGDNVGVNGTYGVGNTSGLSVAPNNSGDTASAGVIIVMP